MMLIINNQLWKKSIEAGIINCDLNGNFSHIQFTSYDLYKLGFERKYSDALGSIPNGGCIWKPYIIRLVLENCMEGDTVIYSDCGDSFSTGMVQYTLANMDNGFFFLETPHNHRRYTKKYCFKYMDAMYNKYLDANQLDAGYVAFRYGKDQLKFVREWEKMCYNTDVLLDHSIGDEWDDLIRHSRDQSILTNLQLWYNYPAIHVSEVIGKYIRFNVRSG